MEIKAQKRRLKHPTPSQAQEDRKCYEWQKQGLQAFTFPNFRSLFEVLPGKLDQTLYQELIFLAHGIIEGILIYLNSCFLGKCTELGAKTNGLTMEEVSCFFISSFPKEILYFIYNTMV